MTAMEKAAVGVTARRLADDDGEQVIEATGWQIRFADSLSVTAEPTEVELAALRALEARTAAAHGQAPGEA